MLFSYFGEHWNMLNILTRFSIDIAMSYASLPNCNKHSAMQQLLVNNYMVHIYVKVNMSLLLFMLICTVLKDFFLKTLNSVMHATVY